MTKPAPNFGSSLENFRVVLAQEQLVLAQRFL